MIWQHWSVLALGACAAMALAQPAANQPGIGLPELVSLAAGLHPGVLAASAETASYAGARQQALAYPNPTVEFAVEEQPVDDRWGDSGLYKVALVQPLVMGPRRELAAQVSELEAAQAEADQHALLRDLALSLGEQYAERVNVRRRQETLRELLSLAGQSLELATIRAEAGASPRSDQLAARLEVEKLQLALATLASREQAAASRMMQLLGGVTVSATQLAEPVLAPALPPFAALLPAALAADQQVVKASLELQRLDAQTALARAELRGDWALRVGAGYDAEAEGGIVEAAIEIPLTWWDRGAGRAAQLKSRREAARQAASAARQSAEAELREAYLSWQAAQSGVQQWEQHLLPTAAEALSLARSGYEAGYQPFLELLDAQRAWSETRLGAVEAHEKTLAAQLRLELLLNGNLTGERP